MARRKTTEKNIRKITKMASGGSFGITIPIEMVRRLGWRERQKVEVELKGRKLIVKDWRR